MDEFYLPRLKLDRNLIWRVSFKGTLPFMSNNKRQRQKKEGRKKSHQNRRSDRCGEEKKLAGLE